MFQHTHSFIAKMHRRWPSFDYITHIHKHFERDAGKSRLYKENEAIRAKCFVWTNKHLCNSPRSTLLEFACYFLHITLELFQAMQNFGHHLHLEWVCLQCFVFQHFLIFLRHLASVENTQKPFLAFRNIEGSILRVFPQATEQSSNCFLIFPHTCKSILNNRKCYKWFDFHGERSLGISTMTNGFHPMARHFQCLS